jgi:hypothetical protein
VIVIKQHVFEAAQTMRTNQRGEILFRELLKQHEPAGGIDSVIQEFAFKK